MADTSRRDLDAHSRAMFFELDDANDTVFAESMASHVPALREALGGLIEDRYAVAGSVDSGWAFYALSRVLDRVAYGERTGRFPPGSMRELFEGIGAELLTTTPGAAYSPLYHEVVAVDTDPLATSVTVTAVELPGARWGALILAREWVTVHAPADLMPGDVPARRLMFAHERPNRPVEDLSHGWGHNSQWGTEFHRCYDTGVTHVFNANGYIDLAVWPPTGASPDEIPADLAELAARRDVLTNRTWVLSDPVVEAWPFDDTLTVRADATWPYTDTDLVAVSDPGRFGSLPLLELAMDSFASLWSVPDEQARAAGVVKEPLDLGDLILDPDLRVRIDAFDDAVNAAVWEAAAYKSSVEWDPEPLEVEEASLRAELARRRQPLGWRLASPELGWVHPTGDRSTIPPPTDSIKEYELRILRELGVRHVAGGNAVVCAWTTTSEDTFVIDKVAERAGADPVFRDRRDAVWVTSNRVVFETDPVRNEVFVTEWVAVRDANHVKDWGPKRREAKTVIEMGRIVLPAPRMLPG